ncbi:hypothetical protein ACQRC6_04800 [Peptoniphilus sp. SGI.035]|uniref:hypothetical protein n=1 Tax=Peptoniphilus sp. SGI.035 TaxID=3420564 RepID=UPI003CFDFDA4
MIRLSKDQILSLHQSLMEHFGGKLGIRDAKLVDVSVISKDKLNKMLMEDIL